MIKGKQTEISAIIVNQQMNAKGSYYGSDISDSATSSRRLHQLVSRNRIQERGVTWELVSLWD